MGATMQSFRLTPADIAILDHAQAERDLTSRTESLRYILRDWADEVGFDWKSKAQTKKKGKKK